MFCYEIGRFFAQNPLGNPLQRIRGPPPLLAVRKGRGWALALWWGPSWGGWGPSKRCWGPQQGLNVPKIVSNVTRPFKHVNLDTPTKVFATPTKRNHHFAYFYDVQRQQKHGVHGHFSTSGVSDFHRAPRPKS